MRNRLRRGSSDEDLYPSLEGRGPISLDCETWDPELKTKGPGWHRDDTYIAGVAIKCGGLHRYYATEHPEGNDANPDKTYRWLAHELKRPNQPKIGANLLYDVGFLGEYGIDVKGPLWDVQIAEPLLNEHRLSYGLEALSKDYLGTGKIDDDLEDYIRQHFGKEARTNPKRLIAKCPAGVVAPYGEGDVHLPEKIFLEHQRPELERQGLWSVFEMERKLIPILHKMRKRAIRVDLDKAEQMRDRCLRQRREVQSEMRRMVGFDVAVWEAKSLARAFDQMGIRYALTPKTRKPSFTKGYLDLVGQREPFAKLVLEDRRLDKMVGTFLEGCILDAHHNGRVYCNFNQLKGEDGGAVSGRFSSSMPNLQFIPVRTEDGKLIRSIFIADEGEEFWHADYSQIEYRLMCHDAADLGLPGGQEIAQRFIDDPDVDFHMALAEDIWGYENAHSNAVYRGRAKTINFGLAYGEGEDKLAGQLGVSVQEARRIISDYHVGAPFMKPLIEGSMRQAQRNGEIITLLGRKQRFLWGRTKWNADGSRSVTILPHRVPGATRVFTHKALNARTQGSAADIMKAAMVAIDESGVLEELGYFALTVHDELDGSSPRTRTARQALRELKQIMENVVVLHLPLKVDVGIGKNWGDLEGWTDEEELAA